MKTILNTYLNKYLNEMFDNLLNKALEEKPLIITNNGRVKYTYIDFYFGKHDVEINIKHINNNVECGFFRLILTDNQKKMRDKIFDKWKEEGGNYAR